MAPRPTSPSWLVVTALDDPRGRLDTYWSRLAELDVPTPETVIRPLDEAADRPWNGEQIRGEMVDQGWQRAFVRTGQKAAPRDIESGSVIHEPSVEEIDRTIEALLGQVETSGWGHGGTLVLREWLDLSFCADPTHWTCHPEVRYMIEGGEVLFGIATDVGPESVCERRYPHLTDMLRRASAPLEAARTVANEFDELPWAVDFALDASGTWYCVELNLNGVRWEPTYGDWIDMCGHAERAAYGPRVIHAPALDGVEPVTGSENPG